MRGTTFGRRPQNLRWRDHSLPIAEEYDINDQTAHVYMRMYRDINQLPPKRKSNLDTHMSVTKASASSESQNLETYENMTKEELIQALVQARITEARLKKVTK